MEEGTQQHQRHSWEEQHLTGQAVCRSKKIESVCVAATAALLMREGASERDLCRLGVVCCVPGGVAPVWGCKGGFVCGEIES